MTLRKQDFHRIDQHVWEVPKTFRPDMNVPARLYATERMLESILQDRSVMQLINVATLPGIVGHAIAMPDVHEGYGFPIGGVAAVDPRDGVISPGGIGYDINCGVRMLRSDKTLEEIRPVLKKLAHSIAREIPSGTGRGGRVKLRGADMDAVLRDGAARMVEMGHGEPADLEHLESSGRIAEAEPELVSSHARERGHDQLGTIGSGNHFVEIDVVDTVYDAAVAEKHGIREGQITILIHTGSRGLGHQVATDFLKVMSKAMAKHGISVADPQLACAPFASDEGQRYFRAMAAAANFAWANRQLITSGLRRAWQHELGAGAPLEVIYDVAHNVAKIEEHVVGGRKRRVVVHRKGATRAFPDQPVLIPGSMGTASYLMVGREKAMAETFGSSCHGAGRVMSRKKAKAEVRIGELLERLEKAGIVAEAASHAGLVEEAPEAYKDIDMVIGVVADAGIAARVARVRPVAVIKG